MRACALCKKKFANGTGNLFGVPKDLARRTRWGEICGRNFKQSNIICADHFLPSSIVRTSKNMILLPNAEPRLLERAVCDSKSPSSDMDNSATAADPYVAVEPFHTPDAQQLGEEVLTLQPSYKSEETQTDFHISYSERIRALERENKELKLKLEQTNRAIYSMSQIFSESQIRKLMSPGPILWKPEDISNAKCLYAAGSRAYNHLYKKGFPLPHVTTLQRCKNNTQGNRESSNEFILQSNDEL